MSMSCSLWLDLELCVVPTLSLVVLLISRAQSCFWGPLSLHAYAVLRKYFFFQDVESLHDHPQGYSFGKGSKLGLLAKMVDAISRNPRPPCMMEYVLYVASALGIFSPDSGSPRCTRRVFSIIPSVLYLGYTFFCPSPSSSFLFPLYLSPGTLLSFL